MNNTLKKICGSLTGFVELLIVLAILLYILSCNAGTNPTLLLSGTYTTNFNAGINAGTNSFGVNTNNYYLATIPALSNVNFTLSQNLGALPSMPTNWLASGTNNAFGTNAWPPSLPAVVFNPQGNYPGTLYGPARMQLLIFNPSLMTTNVGISSISAVFAGSADGVIWVTNILTMVTTVPVNSLAPANPAFTNWDSQAWPIVALQLINNSTNTVNLTNIWLEASDKPGL